MALLVYLLAIPTGFIGPLILWLIKKDQSRFLDDQGKEVLNWSITLHIAQVACGVLMFAVIGMFLLPLVMVVHVVFTILGALKANQGVAYRYPFAIRLLK